MCRRGSPAVRNQAAAKLRRHGDEVSETRSNPAQDQVKLTEFELLGRSTVTVEPMFQKTRSHKASARYFRCRCIRH